jgi:cytidylate kinase
VSAPVITIDGPGGSGKGTISRLLAARLGWRYLDSGALYRVTAYAARAAGIDLDNQDALAELAASLPVAFDSDPANEDAAVTLDGQLIGNEIRTEAAGEGASRVAVHPPVRAALMRLQHSFQQPPGLVADGRDMGTVVFPQAEVKIFLTASAEERAKRRHNQLREKGISASLAGLLREIEKRDKRDSERVVAPLRPAADADVVDSTNLTIDNVVELIFGIAKNRLNIG